MTRANTTRPGLADGEDHPTHSGAHTDALEHGMPTDRKSEGAGPSDRMTDGKPSASPNDIERTDYPRPEHDPNNTGGGTHNHRSAETPSVSEHIGGRGRMEARGVMGDGQGGTTRGSSGKYRGVNGAGEVTPKAKGCMGC